MGLDERGGGFGNEREISKVSSALCFLHKKFECSVLAGLSSPFFSPVPHEEQHH